MNIEKLEAWFLGVLSLMVTHPQDIKFTRTTDEMGILFTISVNKEDEGKVIGMAGSIVGALRVILRSAGRMEGVRVSLKIEIPGSGFEVRKAT